MSDGDGDREPEDTFSVAIKKCYQLGDRLKRTPLFKSSNVRKYKRLHEKELDRLLANTEFDQHGDDNKLTFVDYSILGHFAVGTPAYKYYHSWPRSIKLLDVDNPTAWNLTITSPHCPFCSPSGRCETLKDLVDHLETHHQQFTYRTKRNDDDSALIMMKVRDNRWIENEIMFRVSTEGYLVSSRLRRRFPDYVPKIMKRRDPDFPFVVKFCGLPETYLGFVPQPKEMSAKTSTVVKKERPRRTLRKSKSASMVLNEGVTQTESRIANKKSPKRTQTRRPTVNIAPKPKSSGKRKPVVQPSGMGNANTVHFRNIMFGERAYQRNAGEGLPSRLESEAAVGRLYSTVTNVPLDVTSFNAGFDSDMEDGNVEIDWRLEQYEEHIQSFVDVLPIEKYFSVLWNSFALNHKHAKCDRDVQLLYVDFVRVHGGEVKRMKLEVVFAMQVMLSWQQGVLDAEGVMEVLKKLRECEPSVREAAGTNFKLPERLERDDKHPFKKVRTYTGQSRWMEREIRNSAFTKWVESERESLRELEHAEKAIQCCEENYFKWMSKITDV